MKKVFVPFYKIWTNKRSQALFWSRVEKTDGCWIWTGSRHRQGYGLLTLGQRPAKAHRISYFLANGYIDLSEKVLHKCDNPPCVNPAHLWLGTQADNVADMVAKGRNGFVRLGGEKNPMARLDWEKVRAIRSEYATGAINQAALADKYHMSKMAINRVVNGGSWRE